MKKSNTKKGFTLLEALIAISVITFVIVIITISFLLSMRIFSEELSSSGIQYEAKKAMERMTQELRGALEIVSAESSSVTFWWKDLNGNTTREVEETVSFYWDGSPGSTLKRTEGTDTINIIYNVNNLLFTYQDSNNIKLITINLTAAKENTISTLESSIKLRNL